MSANVANQVAYLRTTKEFPIDPDRLNQELTRTYSDIATNVNSRIIGLYPTTKPAITGERWFVQSNQKQQTLRQVYTFTGTTDINIGFKLSSIYRMTEMYGTYTSGTTHNGLIAGTSVAIAGVITFYLDINAGSTTSDVIKFNVGAGAPALTDGLIVLCWLSKI